MDHVLNTTYFLTACMVSAANPFLTIVLIIAAYFDGSLYDILKLVYGGAYDTLIVALCLAPVLIILYAVSRLHKWHGM